MGVRICGEMENMSIRLFLPQKIRYGVARAEKFFSKFSNSRKLRVHLFETIAYSYELDLAQPGETTELNSGAFRLKYYNRSAVDSPN